MAPSVRTTISAQPGPQTGFLRSAADICIYGGAAGGGKTVGLILEPLRYVSRVPGLPRYSSAAPPPRSPTPAGYGTRAKTSIRDSVALRICERKNGAGRAAARSSFRI